MEAQIFALFMKIYDECITQGMPHDEAVIVADNDVNYLIGKLKSSRK